MKSEDPLIISDSVDIQAFEVTQALIGLELGDTDESILGYFDFLSRHIPIEAAYFMNVMHPITPIDALFEKETQSVIGDYEIQDDVAISLAQKVRQALSKYEDIYVEYSIAEGKPLEKMLETADDLQTDLLVIGQSSKHDFHGILAKNLIRQTPSTALVIPDQSICQLSRILVPIDFSPNSIRALKTALSINRRLTNKARIYCLHVYQMPDINMYRISRNWEQYKIIIEENINDAFKVFLSNFPSEDLNCIETHLVQKDLPGTGRIIMNFADENEIDGMVMGAKGHSKVHLLLLGSVTEKVLSLNTHIPTFIVK